MWRMKIFFAGLALAVPLIAQADLIAYDFDGSNVDGWNIESSLLIDQEDVSEGIDLVPFIVQYIISWTNGADSFSVNEDNSSIFSGGGELSSFFVNADLNVSDVAFCVVTNTTDFCNTPGHPAIELRADTWSASVDPFNAIGGSGEWYGPRKVTSVPEPGTLALLGLGLVGIGMARRRQTARDSQY